MKKIFNKAMLLMAVVSVVLFSSCRHRCIKGSGRQTTENHKLEKFNRIKVSGGFKVHLTQNSSFTASVTGDDNLQQYIHLESDGDELHIYTKKNFCGSGEIVINVGIGDLESLKGSGAVDFISDGKIVTKDLDLKLNGASNVDLDLNAATVTTEANGNCELKLKGQATQHRVNMNGAGAIHAFDFVVGKYDIRSAGASDCEINVLSDLEVHSTGASDVKYKGNPPTVNSSKLGAGTVTHVN